MASVRMTQELRMQIRRNAENAYDLSNPEPKPNNEYVDTVRKAVLNSPEQKFLKDMFTQGQAKGLHQRAGKTILPFKNRDAITDIDLRLKDSNVETSRNYDEQEIQFAVQLPEWWVVEDQYNRWGNPSVYIQDLDAENMHEVTEQFLNFQAIHETARKARQAYNNSITDLLEKVTTLKQLLEIWPAAESLVPDEKLQKMHVKVTRKQKAEAIKEEIAFDPTLANQTVLTAKLLGV